MTLSDSIILLLLVGSSRNIIDTQSVTIPDVQPPAKHNGMRPRRAFSRILDLQSSGELKTRVRRFHQGHVAVVGVEIEHSIGVRQTPVLVFVGGPHGRGLEERLARLEIDARPRLRPLGLRISVQSAFE